jgi:lysophospholipid acyltransferase (LPLAT)-like uncharacterized protein
VKPGLIAMAQVSGAAIFPIIVSADRAWVMGSWDHFLVPKPFSKVTIKWGKPFLVPRRLPKDQSEALRQDIEKSLQEAYAEADLDSGWKTPL